MSPFHHIGLRLNLDQLIPEKSLIQINKLPISKNQNPLFCVHSIEGTGDSLLTLANLIDAPVYCFQSGPQAPQVSIELLAAYYIEQMKLVQPQGPYRLLGYSYGACVTLEMALTLQRQSPQTPGIVESVLLLDGSHLYMQTYRDLYRLAFGIGGSDLTNNPQFETELLLGVAARFAPAVDDSEGVLRGQLMAAGDYRARLTLVARAVVEQTKEVGGGGLKERDFEFFADSIYQKFKMADKYRPQDKQKFKGQITLIRASAGAMNLELVGPDYGLQKITEGHVTVHTVEGDHDSFVQTHADKTASIVNEQLKSPEGK